MFLRFVGHEVDDVSGVWAGIFHAAVRLRDSGTLEDYEHAQLWELSVWFNRNLETPTRFSRDAGGRVASRGICWFKPTANEHLAKAHEMRLILESHGVLIRVLKAARVGYLVYEDEHQVVAEPVRDMRL